MSSWLSSLDYKVVLGGGVILGVAGGLLMGKKIAMSSSAMRMMIHRKRPVNAVDVYIEKNTLKEYPVLKKLREKTEKHSLGSMISSPVQVQLMALMARSINAKKVIEVGVYTGYNLLSMALAVPDDGLVIGCDISSEYADIGRPYWEEAGVMDKIDLRIQPAAKTLNELIQGGERETFDFAYIDADKENYNEYYEKCYQLLRKGGLLVIDNVIWSGKVVDESINDPATEALRQVTQKASQDKRVDIVMLNLSDGVLICLKK